MEQDKVKPVKHTNGFESGKDKHKLTITVSLTDTEIFDQLKDLYVYILGDERIEENIREEYYSRLEIIMKENINR
ncbi:hypothetical protein [Terrisporobacter petrolearius]|uniref:hypothetical protein n=1 Tax=Terrisporobacter petrolearius TaxID=1460447 RepID=UPI0031CC3A5F